MDINHDTPQPHTHYEYIYEKKDEAADLNSKTKQRAFLCMEQLEGWCTKSKASFLVDLVLMFKPKTIVEIGVFGGKSLVPMAVALRECGVGKVYGIDPWESSESVIGMDGVNRDYWGSVNHEMIFKGLKKKVIQFGLQNQISLIRSTSLNAEPIADIDVLHIDGNHSEETSYIDVTKWVPLVKKGGWIIFDDVNWSTTGKAVEWLNAHCLPVGQFYGDNIWGLWVKQD